MEKKPKSMKNIDLNIINYSLNELEKFMGLSPNYVYNDINNRCSEMIDIIEKSKEYKLSYKKAIISFLNEAKLKLIKEKKRIKNEEELDIKELDLS